MNISKLKKLVFFCCVNVFFSVILIILFFYSITKLQNNKSFSSSSSTTTITTTNSINNNQEVVVFDLSSSKKITYKCFGSCYCVSNNNEKEERKTTAIISSSFITKNKKIMSFLVISISSFLAHKKAKEYFENECFSSKEVICDKSSTIQSSVDNCKSIVVDDDVEEEEEKKEEESTTSSSKKTKQFWCKGNCVPKHFNKEEVRFAAEEFGCNRFKKESVFDLEILNENIKNKFFSFFQRKKGSGEDDSDLLIGKAKKYFIEEILEPYCWKESNLEYITFDDDDNSNSKIIHVCSARTGKKKNPKIGCMQIK